jgi:hypothetical protein
MFGVSSFLYVSLSRLSKHWMFLWKFSPFLLQRLKKPKCSLAIEFSLMQIKVFSCNRREGFLNFITKLGVCNQTLCISFSTSRSMDAWSLKFSKCISFPPLCPLMCGKLAAFYMHFSSNQYIIVAWSLKHYVCSCLPTSDPSMLAFIFLLPMSNK